jgi:hypothetical protein
MKIKRLQVKQNIQGNVHIFMAMVKRNWYPIYLLLFSPYNSHRIFHKIKLIKKSLVYTSEKQLLSANTISSHLLASPTYVLQFA